MRYFSKHTAFVAADICFDVVVGLFIVADMKSAWGASAYVPFVGLLLFLVVLIWRRFFLIFGWKWLAFLTLLGVVSTACLFYGDGFGIMGALALIFVVDTSLKWKRLHNRKITPLW